MALQIHSLGAFDGCKTMCHHCPSQRCGLNDTDPLLWDTLVAEKGIKLLGVEYQPANRAMYLVSFINLKAEMEKKGQEGKSGASLLAKKTSWSTPVPRAPSGLVAFGCGWPRVSKKGCFAELQLVRNELFEAPRGKHNAAGFPLGKHSAFGLLCMRINSRHKGSCQLPTPYQHRVLLRLFFFFNFFFNSFKDSQTGSCSSFEINKTFAISLSPCLPLDWHSSTAQVLCLWISLARAIVKTNDALAHSGLGKEKGMESLVCSSWQDESWPQKEILEGWGSHHVLRRRAEPHCKVRHLRRPPSLKVTHPGGCLQDFMSPP